MGINNLLACQYSQFHHKSLFRHDMSTQQFFSDHAVEKVRLLRGKWQFVTLPAFPQFQYKYLGDNFLDLVKQ